jgi:DNA-binding MarR family transcriptional regulator
MAKAIVDLVNDAKVLNADVVTLPRILILAALKDLSEDGATFRELKATLDMSDGTLFSNLKALKKMGYVKESKVEVEDKEMHSFSITREGKEMFYAVCSWFNELKG